MYFPTLSRCGGRGGVCRAPGVTRRRGVPPTRHGGRSGVCRAPGVTRSSVSPTRCGGKSGVCRAPELTRRGVPPTRPGHRGRVCRAASPWDLLGGSRAQHRLLHSQLRHASGSSGDAQVGGALSQSLTHQVFPPLRIPRVSLPPAMKGRTLTVTPTPIASRKLTRALASS